MNDLQAYISERDIVEVFKEGGSKGILDEIEAQALSLVPDVTTAKGRKAIASTANHVARSKTYLDGLGKSLAAGLRRQVAAIDLERRTIRGRLDELKYEVRLPLTNWEAADKARIKRIQGALRQLECQVPKSLDGINDRISKIDSIAVDDSFCEFKDQAQKAKEASLSRLMLAKSEIEQTSMMEKLEKQKRDLEEALLKVEQMKAEAARADAEAVEREAKAKEAAARAKAEAAEREAKAKEAAARAEAEAAEREAKAKEAAARAEAEAAERAARAKANADAARAKASASLVRLCSLNEAKAGEILNKIENREIHGVSCVWS